MEALWFGVHNVSIALHICCISAMFMQCDRSFPLQVLYAVNMFAHVGLCSFEAIQLH